VHKNRSGSSITRDLLTACVPQEKNFSVENSSFQHDANRAVRQ